MFPARDLMRRIGLPLIPENITREAFIRQLAECVQTTTTADGKIITHSSATLLSPELVVFLGCQDKEMISVLTDWFDCHNEWTYMTKHFGCDEIVNLWLNILGGITPELLQAFLPMSAIGGGFTSRVIFVFEEKRGKTVPLPIMTEEEVQLREDLTHDLEQVLSLSGNFKLSEQFIDLYTDWYLKSETDPPFQHPYFAGYLTRRAQHISKLSMIMSASRSNSMIITDEDFMRAKNILERAERKMTYAFTGMGREANSDTMNQIMSYIAEHGTCFFHELMQNFYYHVDKWRLEKIIETLVEMRFCKMEHRNNGNKLITFMAEDKLKVKTADLDTPFLKKTLYGG